MNLDFESKFRHIIKKMEEAGNNYAELKGQSWQAQEVKGSVLSKIIQRFGDCSQAKAEILAKGTEDYKRYVEETAEAIKKELRAKCEYEKWKASFEALRSLSSLEKHTMDKIG